MLWVFIKVPQWDTSNEYHNMCFYGEIRKISELFGWKKPSYLELWCYEEIIQKHSFPDLSLHTILYSFPCCTPSSITWALYISLTSCRSNLNSLASSTFSPYICSKASYLWFIFWKLYKDYCIYPKYSLLDKQASANSVDPDQTQMHSLIWAFIAYI